MHEHSFRLGQQRLMRKLSALDIDQQQGAPDLRIVAALSMQQVSEDDGPHFDQEQETPGE